MDVKWPQSLDALLEQERSRTPEDRADYQSRKDQESRQRIDLESRANALAFAQRNSQLGERFEQRTFATYQIPPGDDLALKIARNVAEDPATGAWFYGGFGNGKTHLVAAIVNECVQKLIPSTFTPVLGLLDLLKRSYDRSDRVREGQFDVIDAMSRVPVLVLDDLDKAEFTPWASQRIYALINARYERHLPLIVTSNATPAELGISWAKKGLDATISGAIIDRMREMCRTYVRVRGESQRGKL